MTVDDLTGHGYVVHAADEAAIQWRVTGYDVDVLLTNTDIDAFMAGHDWRVEWHNMPADAKAAWPRTVEEATR